MAFYCIADEDTVRGFRLAGVSGQPVPSPEDAAEAFAWAVAQPDCDILILTEDVTAALSSQLEAFRLEHERPLLVEIPGPGGSRKGDKDLRHLIQSAVGANLEKES